MNKEKAIRRVNTFGKVGRIVMIVLASICGLLTMLFYYSFIMFCFFDDNYCVVNSSSTASVEIDMSNCLSINDEITVDDIEFQKFFSLYTSAFANKKGYSLGNIDFDSENNKINLELTVDSLPVTLSDMRKLILFSAIWFALAIIPILFAYFLCHAFANCYSPFENNVIKSMKWFSFSLFPWALFSSVPSNYINKFSTDVIHLNITSNIVIIIAALIILALAYIFKYGSVLQNESDETL